MAERVCEKCGSLVPDEWITKEKMGTCPTCKELARFVPNNQELKEVDDELREKEEHEIKERHRHDLLNKYGVIAFSNSNTEKVIEVNLAKLVLAECGLHFKTVEDEDTGKQEIFFYDGGYYHRGGENRIKSLVDYYLDCLTNIHRKNEVIDYIKNISFVHRHNMEPPVHLINVKNGIYNLKTDELIEHSPDYFFLNQIPIDYNPDAKCPKIEKFMGEVLYPERVPTMQEAFGYCLYRKYAFHKAFMLLGGGRNGKGTIIQLLEAFVGKKSCASQSLHSLVENRFAKSSLYGKLVNLGAEVSGRALSETADFKNLTGGEPITAERKNYGAFSFKNYAKLFFNVNTMIRPKYDKSQAYYDRWVIFTFPNTYELGEPGTIVDLINELTTKEELEGLLMWAIAGLKRLLATKNFSYSLKEDSSGELYDSLVKPEFQFISDHLVISYGINIDKDDVYTVYRKWASERRYQILSKNAFTRQMKTYFTTTQKQEKDGKEHFVLDTVDTRIDYDRKKMYKDITWKDTVYEKCVELTGHKTQTSFETTAHKQQRIEESLTSDEHCPDFSSEDTQKDEEEEGVSW